MSQQVLSEKSRSEKLSSKIKPLCPRDGHAMHYEAKGIVSKTKDETLITPSYHCGFEGCSVRYMPSDGYFTVINMPDLPHFVEEPGTNTLQCPSHGTWLYRSDERASEHGQTWRCGVDGCDYMRNEVAGL
jgi:hypothetical protein